jgi:hypothetical protein
MGEAILSVSAASAGETAHAAIAANKKSNPRWPIASLLLLLLRGRVRPILVMRAKAGIRRANRRFRR